jgi:hypothetical protein
MIRGMARIYPMVPRPDLPDASRLRAEIERIAEHEARRIADAFEKRLAAFMIATGLSAHECVIVLHPNGDREIRANAPARSIETA